MDYAKNNLAQAQQGAALGGLAGNNMQALNMGAAREMTVGELIDRRIEKAERQARDLRILKDAMSQGFLQSGASKISSLLEL